ncbi:restriction endonuclease subunit S [Streptosporangium sandarakinum]|uniref:restriction endonuclease subunit S n=1 Tax=Streptosporangium sandarakinum TaxID=1260955 RepID=UPI0036B97DC0
MTNAHTDLAPAWTTSIPRHWCWMRNKELLFEAQTLSKDGSEELLSVSHLTGVGPRSEKNVTMTEAESLEGYRVVEQGDLVINTMWAWMGALGVARHAGIVSPAYGVYRPRPSAPFGLRFFDYLYRSTEYVMEMTRVSRGIWSSRLRLYPEVFLRMAVPVPPLEEQRAIADYLDRETARIDTLIEEQQRLIEMLRERRSAMITQVATRGLDDAPLIDSGNIYLGDVPAHWKVSRFSREMSVNGGQVDPRDNPWADMVLVAPNHIESGTGRIIGRETARAQGADSGKYLASAGQILYSKIRPALNKVTVATEDCLTSADMYAMSSTHGDDHRYLMYFMLARPFHAFVTLASLRVKMPKVNREELGEAPFLLPPVEEQRRIRAYLDDQTEKIDALITEAVRLIELSHERRSALITAAVTGQVDVRKVV